MGLLRGVQVLVDSADEEAGILQAAAKRSFRERAQFLANGGEDVFGRSQDVLFLGRCVGQVVAFDLVEVREHEQQLAGTARGDHFLHSCNRRGLHRLDSVIDEHDGIG